MDFDGLWPLINNPKCYPVHEMKFAEHTASGWSSSLAVPYIEYTGWDNIYDHQGKPNQILECPGSTPESDWRTVIKRITVHLPSGETHELRIDDTKHSFSPLSSPPSKNGTYYAVDGSNVKYVEDSDNGTYKLLMPDGSWYEFSSSTSGLGEILVRRANKYTDRNGNYTSFNATTSDWTDTLGRTLESPVGLEAPSNPVNQTYSMPGMEGDYTFKWKRLQGPTQTSSDSALTDPEDDLKYVGDRYFTGTYPFYYAYRSAGEALFSSGSNDEGKVNGGDVFFNPVVLAEVELPTGQSYKFTYDIYGRIEAIYYPTGGKEEFDYEVVKGLTLAAQDDLSVNANFGVVERRLYPDAGNGSHYTWNYSATHVDPAGYLTKVIIPMEPRSTNICIGLKMWMNMPSTAHMAMIRA